MAHNLQISPVVTKYIRLQHSASLTALQPAPVAGFGMSEGWGSFKKMEKGEGKGEWKGGGSG